MLAANHTTAKKDPAHASHLVALASTWTPAKDFCTENVAAILNLLSASLFAPPAYCVSVLSRICSSATENPIQTAYPPKLHPVHLVTAGFRGL